MSELRASIYTANKEKDELQTRHATSYSIAVVTVIRVVQLTELVEEKDALLSAARTQLTQEVTTRVDSIHSIQSEFLARYGDKHNYTQACFIDVCQRRIIKAKNPTASAITISQ